MQAKYIQVLTVILALCSCTSKHAPLAVQPEPMKIECEAKCTVHVPMPGSKATVVKETNGYDMGIAIVNGLVNVADEGLIGYAFWTLRKIADGIKGDQTTTTTTTGPVDQSVATTTTTSDSNNSTETTTNETNEETTSTTTTSDDDTTTTTTTTNTTTTTEDNDTTTTTTEYDNDTTTTTTTTTTNDPPP